MLTRIRAAVVGLALLAVPVTVAVVAAPSAAACTTYAAPLYHYKVTSAPWNQGSTWSYSLYSFYRTQGGYTTWVTTGYRTSCGGSF